jgi:hypothetical protein
VQDEGNQEQVVFPEQVRHLDFLEGVFMKRSLIGALLAAIVLLAGTAQAFDFQLSGTPGSQIVFNAGGTFQFVPTSNAHTFVVTSPSPNALAGYVGDITGTYTIGSPITIDGAAQTASVTPSSDAYFKLYNPSDSSKYLTAKLNWSSITTYDLSFSFPPLTIPGGTFGGTGGPTWTDVQAFGGDPNLALIQGDGFANVSFQFYPNKNLTQLVAAGGATSFSGSVAAVPEPTTIAGLVGMGLVGLVAVLRRRKK